MGVIMKNFIKTTALLVSVVGCVNNANAAASMTERLDLTNSVFGFTAVLIFLFAYCLVIGEEFLKLRKSKPVLVAAALIWCLIGWIYTTNGMPSVAEEAFNHNLLEYAQLLLFLIVAMTYINAMEERKVFDKLRLFIISKKLSLKAIFWSTGFLAFFISSFANNLTTAMIMCAIILKVADNNHDFIKIACINVVVAANAGGVFSPFGDITTLMVWQANILKVVDFLSLFLPALACYLVPAILMALKISQDKPNYVSIENAELKRGAKGIVFLFLLTIATSVLCHSYIGMPPVLGMMAGLGYLKFYGYYLRISLKNSLVKKQSKARRDNDLKELNRLGEIVPFDVFDKIARSEWDTLLFFYGVVMCVGGLGFMGYLHLISNVLYSAWHPTYANVTIGLLSAIIDNIPVMFAVINMNPDMGAQQWLLVTMTAGVGGSILSVGSAAGVALMGQTKGIYSFVSHLKWSWAIMLGYAVSILIHLLMS